MTFLRKFKIIIVLDQAGWGGADSHLSYLLNSWPNKNDDIHIYYNSYNKGIDRVKDYLKDQNFIKFIKYDHKIINFFEKINSIKFIKIFNYYFIPFRFLIMKSYFNKLFKIHKFDCLISDNGGYPASYACLAAVIEAKKSDIQSVNMLVHHQTKKPTFFYKKFRSYLDLTIGSSLDNLIAVSNATMNALKSNSLIFKSLPKNKSIIIHNGINIDDKITRKVDLLKYFVNPKKKLLGILGRIQKYKGQEDLIYSFLKLPKDYQDKINIAIIGTGELKEIKNLINLIDKYSLNNSVKMLGYIDGRSNDIISSLDLLVFPTRTWEGWGLVAAEAMSVGVPLISSKVGATTEFINDQNGYLIDPSSIEEMTNAMIDFIDFNDRWTKRALQAKKDIKQYDSKLISKKFRDTVIRNINHDN